jgi:hypothetical protein
MIDTNRARKPVTVVRPQPLRAKEDAGINIDADKPYTWAERQYLRLMGAVLGRQLI